jgi:hypothetical protein
MLAAVAFLGWEIWGLEVFPPRVVALRPRIFEVEKEFHCATALRFFDAASAITYNRSRIRNY